MGKDEDIIAQAKKHRAIDEEAWSEINQNAKDDLCFLSDDPMAQWNDKDYNNRVDTGRPALTIDQLGQFVHQVTNDIRMNTPTINVIPHSGGADIETAEVIAGHIKDIEYQSCADEAYDTAANFAVKSSLGFIRIDHDYVNDEGFEQELRIKRVINPQSVLFDSSSTEIDGSDATRGQITDKIKVSEFKQRWPDKDPCHFDDRGTSSGGLKDDDEIEIVEYFVIEEEDRKIGITEDGQVLDDDGTIEFVNTRIVRKKTVKRYKLSGKDVLESTVFPGEYIPIVPVYGEEAWEDGKRKLLSLIRKAKPAQQMYNYWKSLETELLMKQPKAPVIAAAGTVENYAEDWLDPDKAGVLRYDAFDDDGNPLPAPSRLAPPTIPTGVVNASRLAVDDIKATMGLYNASIGQRSNETSGIAIAQRKQEGDVATYHFADNLVKSITHVGRILVSALPVIVDTGRTIRTIGKEEDVKEVGVNGLRLDDQERSYDLRKGKYSVRVVTGASFTTQRQEAAQFFTEIVTRNPALMQVAGDLLFQNMDFPGAQAMAERMKKTIPPQLLDEEDGAEPAPDPEKEQMAQVIQQGQQMIAQMEQEMAGMKQQLDNKQAEYALKAQSEMMDAEIDKEKLQLEREKIALEKYKLDIEMYKAQQPQTDPVAYPQTEQSGF